MRERLFVIQLIASTLCNVFQLDFLWDNLKWETFVELTVSIICFKILMK